MASAPNRDNSLSIYLREISRIPLLSSQEEKRLARLAQKGDGEARRLLIVSNLRLAVSVAKKYLYYGLPLIDLIEEGNIGLMKAVDRFDPERGCKFSTYATWWIRQAVTRSLSNFSRTVRVQVYVTDNIAKYKKCADKLYVQLGRAPEDSEVAKKLKLTVKEVAKLRSFIQDVSLLEKLESTDEDNGRGIPEQVQPRKEDDALVQFQRDEQMEELLKDLTERERNIVRYRYGLEDGSAHTLEQTGKKFDLTRERIRQIEKGVLKKLREFAAEHIEDFGP